ncbi:MAG: DUF4097 family beta strand repeat protein [Sedimentisphaerales bacterium]|nr:DUF4097 family beta strand repeat protein [Sedimentisphaerales bacterium]
MRTAILFPVIGLSLLLSGCFINSSNPPVRVEVVQELTAEMPSGSTLIAESSNGAIDVTGWDQNTCHVVATISARGWTHEEAMDVAEAVEISLVDTGQRMEVQVQKPSVDLARHIGISFDISVPRQSGIDVHTSNGAITAGSLAGQVKARTSNGRINMEQVAGPIDVHTSNGKITCRDVMNNIRAKTSNGGVEVLCAAGASEAPDISIETSNGSITFTAPPNFSARVSARTSNGSVKTDLPILVQGEFKKNRLEGTIGEGTGRLTLRTSNGSIRIGK